MDPEQAARLRRVINLLARQFNTSATDGGLTPTQASVLGLIAGHRRINLADLVRLEHINPTMLSRVVGRLDELGLIVRTPDPEDLRTATLAPTESGHELNARIRDERARIVTSGARVLPRAELAALVAALPALEQLAGELQRGGSRE